MGTSTSRLGIGVLAVLGALLALQVMQPAPYAGGARETAATTAALGFAPLPVETPDLSEIPDASPNGLGAESETVASLSEFQDASRSGLGAEAEEAAINDGLTVVPELGLALPERDRLAWASKGTLAELRDARGFPKEPIECELTRPVRIVLHPKLRMGTKVDNAWAPAAGTGFRACIPDREACRDEGCKRISPLCEIAMDEPGSAAGVAADVYVAYGFLVHHAAQRFVTKRSLEMSREDLAVGDAGTVNAFRRFMGEQQVVPMHQGARQLWVLYNRDITSLPLFAQRAFNATVGYDLYAADIVCPAFMPPLDHLRRKKIVPVEKRRWLASSLVSDCEEYSGRDAYISELEKHMPVARMGMCNHNVDLPCDQKPKKERFNVTEPCPLGPDATEKQRDRVVTAHLMQYKFHLSFERVRCEGYVSEKVFNPLALGVVPVYLGSPLVDKLAISTTSPWVINAHHFGGPRELAEYLLHLDRNPAEYLKYLAWRDDDSLINPTYTELSRSWSVPRSTRMCQVCALYCLFMRRHDATGESFQSRASACPDPIYNPAECSADRRCGSAREIAPLPYLASTRNALNGVDDPREWTVFSPAAIKARLVRAGELRRRGSRIRRS